MRHRGNGIHRQYLVQWLGYDDSEVFWMKANELANAPLVL